MNGCDQEYAIGTSEDVIFSRALKRIFHVTVEYEDKETDEGEYSGKPTRGRIVNEEERDLDEGVECKRKSLHSWARSVGVAVCGRKRRSRSTFNVQPLNLFPELMTWRGQCSMLNSKHGASTRKDASPRSGY